MRKASSRLRNQRASVEAVSLWVAGFRWPVLALGRDKLLPPASQAACLLKIDVWL